MHPVPFAGVQIGTNSLCVQVILLNTSSRQSSIENSIKTTILPPTKPHISLPIYTIALNSLILLSTQPPTMSSPSSLSPTPVEIVSKLLSNTLNPSVVKELVSPTCTYISLCYSNAPLKKIMPYAGVHASEGPAAITYTFETVDKIWANEEFNIEALFSDSEGSKEGVANVAVFGNFTYRSRTLGKKYKSPFSIHCKVEGGRVVYMQFMEDTFGTGATFEKGGSKTYEVEEGVEFEL
jgi:uncharacterized protein